MKKSLLVAAVLLSIGSGCLMPQEAGAATYYWYNNEWTEVNDSSAPSPSGNNAKLPVEGFTVSDLEKFYAGYSSGDDEVENNSFTVGYVEPKVWHIVGGYSANGNVISNEVVITGGNYYTDVYGGRSESEDSNTVVKGNKVTISAANTGFGCVIGGSAIGGSAIENEVIIDAGTVYSVFGGENLKGSATGNIVNINGGSISGFVAGGETDRGSATRNVVNINAGTVKNVFGGVADDDYGSADNNTVNWKAGEINANVYGSVIFKNGVNTPVENNGGTFNVYKNIDGSSKELAEGKLGGFDYMNFYLDNAEKLDTPIVTAKEVILADTPKFGLAVSNASNLKEGDLIKLLAANTGLENLTLTVADNYSELNIDAEGYMPIYKSEISSIQNVDNVLSITYQEDTSIDRVIFGGEEGTGYVKVAGDSLDNIKANDQKLNLNADSYNFYAAVGGFSKDEDVSGNKVTVDGATLGKGDGGFYTIIDGLLFVNGNVYGGYSANGSATGNEVEITGGTDCGYVYGGYSLANDSETVAQGNKVTVSGEETNLSAVYGGYTDRSSAIENEVIINGGSITHRVTGGFGRIEANNNKVTINGGSVIYVEGGNGNGNGGSAKGNTVIINNGTIGEAVDGNIYGKILGGYGSGDSATNNTVTINDGNIIANVVGGYGTVNASNNIVTINGGCISGNVNGGEVFDKGTASNNTVNWKDGDIQGNIFGGALNTYDVDKNDFVFKPVQNTGCTFNVYQNSDGTSKTLAGGKELAGFDYMNFITDNISNPVVTADKVILADNPKFGVAVSNASNLKEGDLIKLLAAESGLENLTLTVADNYSVKNMPEGIMPIYASEIASIKVIDNILSVYYKDDPTIPKVIFGGAEGSGFVRTEADTLEGLGANNQKLNLNADSYNYFAAVGGFSKDEDVSGNKVTIDGATIGKEDGEWFTTIDGATFRNGNVYGGYSVNGSATGNEVEITNRTGRGNVYGGYSLATDSETVAQGNKVTVSGEETNLTEVYGGYTDSSSAIENEVIINGGSITYMVTGGFGRIEANNNKVTINGGSVKYVEGGNGNGGSATGNSVIINGGTIGEKVDGVLYGGIEGGFGTRDSATSNTVTINDGNIIANVIGGDSYGNASNNIVTINGGNISGYVLGGRTYKEGTASNNTVNWKDGDILGNIYGSAVYSYVEETYTPVEKNGGTFNVYHSSGSSSKTIYSDKYIAGFDKMNFYLSGDIKAGDTIIDNSQGNAVDMNNVKTVTLQNDPDKTKKLINNFKKVDVITLISNTTGEKAYEDATLTAGGLDYVFNVNANGEALIATAADDGVEPKPEPEPEPEPEPGPDPKPEPEPEPKPEPKPEPIKPTKVNEETKALLEGHAAAALAVNQMVDNTINVALKDAELAANENNKFNAFVSANYNKDRVSTGSYVDVKGLSGTIGIARKLNNKSGALTYGLFLEGGKNKFDTSNDFASGTVHGKGDANSFGGGLFAKQKNTNGMYVEGSLRVGRVNHDFEGFVAKQKAEYDAKSTYYGAHIGLGKLIASGKGEWDVYGKLIYTHINGATADVYDGSKLELDAMNSTRLRVGGRYNVNPAPKAVGYYAGLAYEYEFGGQADGKLQGFGLEAPTSKGSTGILELGAKFQPSENFGIDLGVEGHAGKRRGVGGNVNFRWSF